MTHKFKRGDIIRFRSPAMNNTYGLGLIKYVAAPKTMVEHAFADASGDPNILIIWFEGTHCVERITAHEIQMVSSSASPWIPQNL